jgi:ATP-binding cassette subfamily F protein 3
MALNEFEGTVLLVSHDRALLREVCDEFWLVTRGGVTPFEGDLDDYQRWLLDNARNAARGGGGVAGPGGSASSAGSSAPSTQVRPSTAEPAAPAHGTPSRTVSSTSTPASPPATRPAQATPPARGDDDRKARAQARQRLADQTRPLRSEITQIDKRLERLAAERAEAEAALATGTLPPAAIADHGRRLNHIAAEVAMLEERWLELQEQVEALQAG